VNYLLLLLYSNLRYGGYIKTANNNAIQSELQSVFLVRLLSLWRNCMQSVLLTLIPLTWRIWWAPNNASKWQMGFNLVFKGLNQSHRCPTSMNFTWSSWVTVILHNEMILAHAIFLDQFWWHTVWNVNTKDLKRVLWKSVQWKQYFIYGGKWAFPLFSSLAGGGRWLC